MTRSRWLLALAVGVALVGTAAGATGGAPTEPAREDAPSVDGIVTAATADGIDAERVVIEVDLHADGSARWSIVRRVRLDDPGDRRGFERVKQRLQQNRSALREPFASRVHAMASEAEAATGRPMVIENVSVEADRTQLPQEYGVVEYSFRWYGFAAGDDRLRAGDAVSRLFLDEDTTLLVTWPDEAALAEADPQPDERRDQAVVWKGPVEFAADEPLVVVESDTLSFGPDFPSPAGSNDVLVTLLALALVVVGVVGVGAGVRRRRQSDEQADATAASDEPAVAGMETTTPDTGDGHHPDGEPADRAATESEGGDTEPEGDDPAPPEELLSNEEQVLALLDERDGRMKQQDVVSELGWSETKTSEVVSDLREAGEIEVYRLGRENVLALPDTGLGIDTGEDDQ